MDFGESLWVGVGVNLLGKGGDVWEGEGVVKEGFYGRNEGGWSFYGRVRLRGWGGWRKSGGGVVRKDIDDIKEVV